MMKKLRSIQRGAFQLTASASLIAGLWTATLPTAWAQAPTPANESPATLQEAKAAEVAAQPSGLDSPLFYQLLIGELT